MLCLLANTLYITPIWAEATQSLDSTKKNSNETTSVSISSDHTRWFNETDNNGVKLDPVYNKDGFIEAYHDTNGKAVALNQVIIAPSEQAKHLMTLKQIQGPNSKEVTVQLTQKGQEEYQALSQNDQDKFLGNMAAELFSEYSNVAGAIFMNYDSELIAHYQANIELDNTDLKFPVEKNQIPENETPAPMQTPKGNSNIPALK